MKRRRKSETGRKVLGLGFHSFGYPFRNVELKLIQNLIPCFLFDCFHKVLPGSWIFSSDPLFVNQFLGTQLAHVFCFQVNRKLFCLTFHLSICSVIFWSVRSFKYTNKWNKLVFRIVMKYSFLKNLECGLNTHYWTYEGLF